MLDICIHDVWVFVLVKKHRRYRQYMWVFSTSFLFGIFLALVSVSFGQRSLSLCFGPVGPMGGTISVDGSFLSRLKLGEKNRGKTSETKPGGCVFISFFFIWGFPKMALIFRGVTSPHLHHFCEFCHATSKDIRRTCPPFGVPEPRNPHFPSGAWAQEEPSRVYH